VIDVKAFGVNDAEASLKISDVGPVYNSDTIDAEGTSEGAFMYSNKNGRGERI
jgi:hypothetical protein